MKKKKQVKNQFRKKNNRVKLSQSSSRLNDDYDQIGRACTEMLESNDLLLELMMVTDHLGYEVDDDQKNVEEVKKIHNSYCELINSKCKICLDSRASINFKFNLSNSSENLLEATIISTLGILASFKINLESLERYNKNLVGLKKMLQDEFPEYYDTYLVLSERFRFNSNVFFLQYPSVIPESNKPLKLIENLIKNSKTLGDKLFSNLLGIAVLLGKKVKDTYNHLEDCSDILSSFNMFLNSKCTFHLDSRGHMSVNYDLWDGSEVSNEATLVSFLAVLACFKINLKSLEIHNNEFKGLNDMLLLLFPETYNAYCKLSKQFGFSSDVIIEGKQFAESGDTKKGESNSSNDNHINNKNCSNITSGITPITEDDLNPSFASGDNGNSYKIEIPEKKVIDFIHFLEKETELRFNLSTLTGRFELVKTIIREEDQLTVYIPAEFYNVNLVNYPVCIQLRYCPCEYHEQITYVHLIYKGDKDLQIADNIKKQIHKAVPDIPIYLNDLDDESKHV